MRRDPSFFIPNDRSQEFEGWPGGPVLAPGSSVRINGYQFGSHLPLIEHNGAVVALDGAEMLVDASGFAADPGADFFVIEARDSCGIFSAEFECRLIYSSDGRPLLQARQLAAWAKAQRRGAFRVQTDLRASVTSNSRRPRINRAATVVDISSSGAAITVDGTVLPDDESGYRLSMALPSGVVSVEVDVVEAREDLVAVEFGWVTADHGEALGSYIFRRQTPNSD